MKYMPIPFSSNRERLATSRGCFKASVFPAAFLTMFEINGISDICLVSPDLAIVQQNRAPHDFILYGIIWSSQFFGNSVYCLFVFVESHLNDMPFFACQVLTFSVFCGIIGFVHSDDSFRIGVWLLNSTTESSLWILFFTIAASFYNLQTFLSPIFERLGINLLYQGNDWQRTKTAANESAHVAA